MILWKQRLYAYLLRRILGPYLDSTSQKKLHESIEISFQEGKFALSDVELSSDYINSLEIDSIRIRKFSIDSLEIHLSLDEDCSHAGGSDDSDDSQDNEKVDATGSTNLAWRTLRLGSRAAMGQPSYLNAKVKISGVIVEVEPCSSPANKATANGKVASMKAESTQSDTQQPSVLSSYVEAALSSLRLSLDIANIKLRVFDSACSFMEIQLSSTSYRDVECPAVSKNDRKVATSNYKTILNKVLKFTDILVRTGECSNKEQASLLSTVGHMNGTGEVCIRAIEYDKSSDEGIPSKQLQQDVEINFNQRFNISVDETSLLQLHSIAKGYQTVSPVEVNSSLKEETYVQEADEKEDHDAANLHTIDGMIKQYHYARHLAERNEVRGGILIPTNAYETEQCSRTDAEEDDNMSYDIFFDANDQSFQNYASVLRETMNNSAKETTSNLCHTKVKLHIVGGGMKVSFRSRSKSKVDGRLRTSDEYILLTFTDLNTTSSVSQQTSDHTVIISHFEIDDSHLNSKTNRAEIDHMLRFSTNSKESNDFLLEAPSISIRAVFQKDNTAGEKTASVDINLEPLELTYRYSTFSKLMHLAHILEDSTSLDSKTQNVQNNDIKDHKVDLMCHCPSASLTIPCYPSSSSSKSSLGITVDCISMERKVQNLNASLKLECNNILFYAASTTETNGIWSSQQLEYLDVLTLSGLVDVDPHIPVTFEYQQTMTKSDFPLFPAISSFKARQEDEGDLEIDQVLSEGLENVNIDAKAGSHGQDQQESMRKTASDCKSIFRVYIPEITLDLSADEVNMLLQMIDSIIPPTQPNELNSQEPSPQSEQKDSLCLAISCDHMNFAIHNEIIVLSPDRFGQHERKHWASYVLRMDKCYLHTVLQKSVRQLRFCAHEASFFEVLDLFDRRGKSNSDLCCIRDRVHDLKQITASNRKCLTDPIFYRSQLFSPISRDTPSVLLDVVVPEMQDDNYVQQKNFYLTIYHMTYRYNIDSEWIGRLQSILQGLHKMESKMSDNSASVQPATLTRAFFSMADCNVDYTSPARFTASSRSIIRIGDLRVSSNLVLPVTRKQALSVSLGDLSIYLCPTRYSYNFENLHLTAAKHLFKPEEMSINPSLMKALTYSSHAVAERRETVFRDMNCRTILTLDSMDGIIAVSDFKDRIQTDDPKIVMSLTFGELSVHACKDSLKLFLGTIDELQKKLTAIDDDELEELRSKFLTINEAENNVNSDEILESRIPQERSMGLEAQFSTHERKEAGQVLFQEIYQQDEKQSTSSADKSITEGAIDDQDEVVDDFNLDGYDWTSVDHLDSSPTTLIPAGEEQVARWYNEPIIPRHFDNSTEDQYFSVGTAGGVWSEQERKSNQKNSINFIQEHFPLQVISNPLGCDDDTPTRFAGTKSAPAIQNRILVHDLKIKVRLYDGYDWPVFLSPQKRRALQNGSFVIDEGNGEEIKTGENNVEFGSRKEVKAQDRRSKLMSDLLADANESESTFQDFPLPEERGAFLLEESELRRLSRRANRYLLLSASGFRLKMDCFAESPAHRLASCLDLTIRDLFLAETIGKVSPVKMIGEWVNEKEHPRDTNDGFIMLKMVTWRPANIVTSDNTISNDEAECLLKILPMRCILDQHAVRFTTLFFRSDVEKVRNLKGDWGEHLHCVPPPLFRFFRTKPCKLKIDYHPKKLDLEALKNGSVVELLNLSPLDGMTLTLDQVDINCEEGFDAVMSALVGCWLQNISAKHMYKFLTNARPFEPLSSIGGGVADLFTLPWDAYRNGENVKSALRSGLESLAGTLTFETLTATSRMTGFIAGEISKTADASNAPRTSRNQLPARPIETPKRVGDAAGHALDSLARGLQTANYKVVVIPYREYKKNGATGAVTSILKGIPVAVAAPVSGATEALSYTLLGARNHILPDVWREEEANQRGLLHFS